MGNLTHRNRVEYSRLDRLEFQRCGPPSPAERALFAAVYKRSITYRLLIQIDDIFFCLMYGRQKFRFAINTTSIFKGLIFRQLQKFFFPVLSSQF